MIKTMTESMGVVTCPTINPFTRKALAVCLLSIFTTCLSSISATAQITSMTGTIETTFPKITEECDKRCLEQTMQAFFSAMTAKQFGNVPTSEQAEIRENAHIVKLPNSTWAKVRAIRSTLVFADAVSGNVIGRAGVEMADGNPAYISTRLKVGAGGRLTDVEIAADTSNRVVKDYVWNLDRNLERPLQPEERIDRVALNALIHRYFMTLSTHVAIKADYDEAACNRFHSGTQITNVSRNLVEGGGSSTCISSNEGNRPWGPATEQRVPVIDEERGIVIGITLLHYLKSPRNSKMYVTEVFKVVKGRIVRIDNIGLMQDGLTTLGFSH